MNNGFSTGPFNMRRGLRQGDPLSPYLFIICLETLAITMRGNKNIQGILLGKEEIKLEMFADDVTAFLRNTRSFEALLHSADLFSKCSGLEINLEKTECMVLCINQFHWCPSPPGNRGAFAYFVSPGGWALA